MHNKIPANGNVTLNEEQLKEKGEKMIAVIKKVLSEQAVNA